MRTKKIILESYVDFKKPGRNSKALRTFTELTKLEVLIDIRDILVKPENRQAKALIGHILGR